MNITVDAVTQLFDVSEKTIYRWIRSRGLPAYRIGNQYRFNRTDLLEWAAAQRVGISPSLMAPDAASAHSETPSLARAIEEGGIYYRVEGNDKQSVLASLVHLMRLSQNADRENLLRILLAREELGSTAIGDGIAIPHARNPIVLNGPRQAITLCFLENPVDFGAIDGHPVHTLFTLITPTIHAHLQLLARLNYALRNDAFRSAVLSTGSRESIHREARAIDAALAPAAPSPAAAPADEA